MRSVDSNSEAALSVVSKDLAEDIQSEARAVARSANATVYSPQLLGTKYSSQPLKVSPNLKVSPCRAILLGFIIRLGFWW